MSGGFWFLLIVCFGLAGGLGYLYQRYQRLEKQLQTIFQGGEIEDADKLIEAYAEKFSDFDTRLKRLYEELNNHEQRLMRSLQKVELLRFNPFDDMGGDMSFILVLLNEDNTGILITNIVMREGTRMYTKQITKGTSSVTLSEEETRVLSRAMKQAS